MAQVCTCDEIRKILPDIEKVVDYLWADEEKHWVESNRPKDHIFVNLRNIREEMVYCDWLKERTKSIAGGIAFK